MNLETPSNDFSSLKFESIVDARTHSINVPGFPNCQLVPVGPWILNDRQTLDAFAHWRKAAQDSFFVRFPATRTSMRNYLKEYSISNPNRILFSIEIADLGIVGHLGLLSQQEKRAEVDAIMLSPQSTGFGLMQASLEAMMLWSTIHYLIDCFELYVVSTNERGVQLYTKLGFIEISREKLMRVERGELVHFIPTKLDTDIPFDRIRMHRTAHRD